MLTVIINHRLNQEAIQLKSELGKFSKVIAVDSGSGLTDTEKQHFELLLDNVFYCGMINAIAEYVKGQRRKPEFVYIIASDVKVHNAELFVNSVNTAFLNEKIGVYAPSVSKNGSPHPQMINKGRNRLRKAVFVDGYCFAVRTKLLQELCPIDTTINYVGWGIDVYLSYLAIRQGLLTVIDDQVTVEHKPSENQHFRSDARNQRNTWYQTLAKNARRYRSLTAIEFLKNEFGASIINSLPWK